MASTAGPDQSANMQVKLVAYIIWNYQEHDTFRSGTYEGLRFAM